MITICEGDEVEGYNQTGMYVDTFQTQNGEDSIRSLDLTVEPFVSITCPANDTFTLPAGFTHIVLKELFQFDNLVLDRALSPVVEPTICFFELETVQTGMPSYKNVFSPGSTNLLHTIKTQTVEESCTYTVHIKEGPDIEKLPSFSMTDIAVTEGTDFCVDVTTANFQEVLAFSLHISWDSTAFEFIETTIPPVYNNNPPLYGFTPPNILIYSWLASDFINGYSIPDSTVIYSLCFKAKKTGQFPINFFAPPQLNLSINEIFIKKENDYVVSEIWLKSANVSVSERIECNVDTTMEAAQICQGENFIFNNQAFNQTGNYETIFTTTNGCDSLVQLALEVLPVPSAITDTFNTKENITFTFNIAQNDIIPADVNWQTAIITPPHVGQLSNLGNGQFSYKPRFSYTGSTTFEYQICNEICLPEGCTTTEVVVNIQGQQLGIDIEPTPLPQPSISQTSKIQLPNPSLQEGELVIFNIYGQQIENKYFFNDAPQQLWNLQQSELPAGIYFYVKRAKGSKKIIKSGKIMAIGR